MADPHSIGSIGRSSPQSILSSNLRQIMSIKEDPAPLESRKPDLIDTKITTQTQAASSHKKKNKKKKKKKASAIPGNESISDQVSESHANVEKHQIPDSSPFESVVGKEAEPSPRTELASHLDPAVERASESDQHPVEPASPLDFSVQKQLEAVNGLHEQEHERLAKSAEPAVHVQERLVEKAPESSQESSIAQETEHLPKPQQIAGKQPTQEPVLERQPDQLPRTQTDPEKEQVVDKECSWEPSVTKELELEPTMERMTEPGQALERNRLLESVLANEREPELTADKQLSSSDALQAVAGNNDEIVHDQSVAVRITTTSVEKDSSAASAITVQTEVSDPGKVGLEPDRGLSGQAANTGRHSISAVGNKLVHNRLPSVFATETSDDFYASLVPAGANGNSANGSSANSATQAELKHKRDISVFRSEAEDDFFSNLSTTVEENEIASERDSAQPKPSREPFSSQAPKGNDDVFNGQDDSFFSSLAPISGETSSEAAKSDQRILSVFAGGDDEDFFSKVTEQKNVTAAELAATATATAESSRKEEAESPFANDETVGDLFGTSTGIDEANKIEQPSDKERPMSFSFLEEDDDLLPEDDEGRPLPICAPSQALGGDSAYESSPAPLPAANRYAPVPATALAAAASVIVPEPKPLTRQQSVPTASSNAFDVPSGLAHAAHRPTLQGAASFSASSSQYGIYGVSSNAVPSVYTQPKQEPKSSKPQRSFFEELPMPHKKPISRKTSIQYLDQTHQQHSVPPRPPSAGQHPGIPGQSAYIAGAAGVPIAGSMGTPIMASAATFQTPHHEYPPPNPYASAPPQAQTASKYAVSPVRSAGSTPSVYAPPSSNPYGSSQPPYRPSTQSPVNPYAPPTSQPGSANTYSPGSRSAYSPGSLSNAPRYSPASGQEPLSARYGHSRNLSSESNTSVGYGARPRHLANEFGMISEPPKAPNPYQQAPRSTAPTMAGSAPAPRTLQPANTIVPKKPSVSQFGDLPSDIEGTSRRMQQQHLAATHPTPLDPRATVHGKTQNFPESLNLRMEEEQSRPLPPVDNESLLKRQFPLLLWGHGKVATVIPGTMSFGGTVTGAQVRVSGIPSKLIDGSTKDFPGPLVTVKGLVKNKKKELEKWMDEKIAELETKPSVSRDFIILWKVVRHLLALDTSLAAAKPSDLLGLRTLLNPALENVKPSELDTFSSASDIYHRVQHRRQSSADSSYATARFGSEQLRAIMSFVELGNREKALRYALDNRLWSHALVIASSLGSAEWNDTVSEFVREEIRALDPTPGGVGQSLAFAYRMFAGAGVDAISEIKPSGIAALPQANVPHPANHALDKVLDNWQHYVSLVICNRSPQDSAALCELGKLLRSHGRIEAAHCCMILSGFPLFGADDGFTLLGTDAKYSEAGLGMNLDTIVLSEIYEYVLLNTGQELGTVQFLPHLLTFKLHHAMILADQGFGAEALRVAEAATSCVKSNAKFAGLNELAEFVSSRLSSDSSSSGGWLSSKLGRSKLDKIWVQSFNKFVSGEEDDTAGSAQSSGDEEGIFKKLAKNLPNSESSSLDSSPNYRVPHGMASSSHTLQRVASFHTMSAARPDAGLNRVQSHANFGGDYSGYRKQSIPGSRSSSPQFNAMIPPRPASTSSSGQYNPYAPVSGTGVMQQSAHHGGHPVGASVRPSSRGAIGGASTYMPSLDDGLPAETSPKLVHEQELHDRSVAGNANALPVERLRKKAQPPPANPYAPPINARAPTAAESHPATNPYAVSAPSRPYEGSSLDHVSGDQAESLNGSQVESGYSSVRLPSDGGALENPYAPSESFSRDPLYNPSAPFSRTESDSNRDIYGEGQQDVGEGGVEQQDEIDYEAAPEVLPEPSAPALSSGVRVPAVEYGLGEEEVSEDNEYSRPGNSIFAPVRSGSASRTPPGPPMPVLGQTQAQQRYTPTIPEEDEVEDLGLGNTKADPKKDDEDQEKKKEAEKKVEEERAKANSGWFSWLRKSDDSNKPKAIRAKLGEESSFYFDEDLKRWVNKKAPHESQKVAAPPPPPKSKAASKTMSVPSTNPSGGPPNAVPSPSPGLASTAPSGTSTPGVPAPPGIGASAKLPAKPLVAATGGLDDLLAAAPSGKKAVRRNARSRYVDIVSQQQQQQ